MARNGAGFDIVSGGELFRVIKAGGDPAKCTYAGVGKTEKEIRYALEQGIYCFNVESEAEMRAINDIAASMNLTAPVAVRVNPNVEAGTHKYITTGKSENKFGVDFEQIESLYEMAARPSEGAANAHRLPAHPGKALHGGRQESGAPGRTAEGKARH